MGTSSLTGSSNATLRVIPLCRAALASMHYGSSRAFSWAGMVVPTVKKVEYVVDLKRVILRRLKLAIADGVMKADGEVIYAATDLRVGLFEAGEATGGVSS